MKSLLRYYKKYKSNGLLPAYSIFKLRRLFPDAFVDSKIQFRIGDYNSIELGEGCSINRFSTIIVTNDPHKELNNSRLIIGEKTYIGEYNNIRAAGGTITIGKRCLISQHITMVSSNHGIDRKHTIIEQPWSINRNFIIIEDDVWIGANSVILPGVTVRKGAVIGAGSIVPKDVPEYAIVCGNPARVIKYRE